MKACPSCSHLLDDQESVCSVCSAQVIVRPDPPRSAPAPPDAGGPAVNNRYVAALAVAALLAGAAAMILLIRLSAAPQRDAAAAGSSGASSDSVAAPAPSPAAAPSETDAAPKWTDTARRGWAAEAGTVAFDLEAERDVSTWSGRVRPVLVVQCSSGGTDVFVITHGAARFEAGTDDYTVDVSFDDRSAATERWSRSVDYTALFAPDGVRLARQIAAARTMRFGFTPFSASPVVVEFDVRGFDTLIGLVARRCRWTP
jgi:hypothetical protein